MGTTIRRAYTLVELLVACAKGELKNQRTAIYHPDEDSRRQAQPQEGRVKARAVAGNRAEL